MECYLCFTLFAISDGTFAVIADGTFFRIRDVTVLTFLNSQRGAQEVDEFDDGVRRHC